MTISEFTIISRDEPKQDLEYLCCGCSVAQLYPTLRPHGVRQAPSPVLHCLPGFAQTHIHRVSDAIQPPCPLLSPSLPAFNLSQHWNLFQWADSSHRVAKVLELQLQYQFFQWLFWVDFLWDWLVLSPWNICINYKVMWSYLWFPLVIKL